MSSLAAGGLDSKMRKAFQPSTVQLREQLGPRQTVLEQTTAPHMR